MGDLPKEVADGGYVKLQHVGGCSRLEHTITGECLCFDGHHEVSLDKDGFAQIRKVGDSEFEYPFWTLRVVTDEGQFYVVDTDGVVHSLHDVRAAMIEDSVVMKEHGTSLSLSDVTVYIFRQSCCFFHVWWSLSGLIKAANIAFSRDMSHWCSNWLGKLSTMCEDMFGRGTADVHVRLARTSKDVRKCRAAQPDDPVVPRRVLGEASLSTGAMIASVTRLSSKPQGGASYGKAYDTHRRNQYKWLSLLSCILSIIFVSSSVQTMIFELPRGRLLHIPVRDSTLLFGTAAISDHGPLWKAAMTALDFQEEASVDDCLVTWQQGGKQLRRLYTQLVLQLAHVLDAQLSSRLETAANVKQHVSKTSGWKWRSRIWAKGYLRERLLMDSHKLAKRAQKYWYCSRRLFQHSWSIGVHLDATRLSKRQVIYGFITDPCGRAAWLVPQVVRDVDLAGSASLQDGDVAKAKTEHSSWYELSQAEWATLQGGAEAAPGKKQYRGKALKWLVGLDLALKHYHIPLRRFLLDDNPAQRPPPEDWPVLSVSLDQGSDGWSAVHFLGYCMPFCVMWLPDPSHRVWNDCQQALKDAGMWGIVTLLTVVFNLDHGPWQDARWLQSAREAVRTYVKLTDPEQCALWQHFREWIYADTGDMGRMAEEGLDAHMFQSLESKWAKTQQKVAMARWFGWIDAASQFLKIWHSRLLILMYLCISLGTMSRKRQSLPENVLRPLEMETVGDSAAAKSSTSNESTAIARLRRSCTNSCEVSIACLSDRTLLQVCQIIVFVCSPIRDWHSAQSTFLRSTAHCLQWYTEQSVGAGFAVLQAMVERLTNADALADTGLGDIPTGIDVSTLRADHPVVMNDNSIAHKTALLTMTLISRRIVTVLWYAICFPVCFCGLLDPARKDDTIQWIRNTYNAWLRIQARPGRKWNALKKRSPFKLLYVSKVISLLQKAGWVVDDAVRRAVEEPFSFGGSTKPVEDAFQKGRLSESATHSRAMSAARIFMAPVVAKVLGQTHSFNEPDYEGEMVPPLEQNRLPWEMFEGKMRDMSVPELKNIRSNQQTPPWHSPSPSVSNQTIADLHAYKLAAADPKWDPDKCWQSMILYCDRTFLVARKGESKLYFTLGNLGGQCSLGWPAERIMVCAVEFYRPARQIILLDIEFLWVQKLTDWEAIPFKWTGALYREIAHGDGETASGILAFPTATRMGLWQLAASRAFWTMPLSALKQFAAAMGVTMPVPLTLFELLKSCIHNAYPKWKKTDVAEVLQLRVKCTDPYEEVLKSNEDVADLLSHTDQKEAVEEQEELRKSAMRRETFAAEYRSWAEKEKVSLGVGCGASASTTRRLKSQLPKKMPAQDEHEYWKEQTMSDYLPPDGAARLYHDPTNKRIQVYWPADKVTRSAAWRKHGGVAPAYKYCLGLAWAQYELRGGFPAPWSFD